MVDKPFGIESLRVTDVKEPGEMENGVRIRVTMGGINPLDYAVVNGRVLYNLNPLPHIVGSEIIGVVEEDKYGFRKGEKVIVYDRVFDGTCDLCLSGNEHICRNGGIWGVVTNGGFTEHVVVSKEALFRQGSLSDEVAVSIPIAALTAYHALMRAGASATKSVLVYGASGNTGLFALQIAKAMGMDVYAVSRKDWVSEFGAERVFRPGSVPDDLRADVVINPLGTQFWQDSLKHVAPKGSVVTFGVQTGAQGEVNISQIYPQEISIVGSTGGTRKEMQELINMAIKHRFRVRVHRKYKLRDAVQAFREFGIDREGRALIEMQ